MCKDMFLNKYLPEHTIVGNGSDKPISQICREWLIHIEAENVVPEVPQVVNNMPDDVYFKMFGAKTKRYYKSHVTPSPLTIRPLKLLKSFRAASFMAVLGAGLN